MQKREPIINTRRKINKEEGFQEGEVIEAWSKKRILIASFVVIGMLGFLGHNLLGFGESTMSADKPKEAQVLGEISDKSNDVELPSRDDIENALENAKSSLEQMTSDNVVSSQAAIQQVIQDLEKVQGGGKDPKDVLCELVCKK